ncbi:hypothetical protein B296_00048421 [Ensete ventricosum]|uniref:Uncharacterized protein n=1 Tax=Ensete ventricosum TaxID=4639 RepID=A0A426YM62_ENSVE|nr:hypothetical protein B296_00048421 [Ensete ventricosum]
MAARDSHNRWKSLSVDGVGTYRHTLEMKGTEVAVAGGTIEKGRIISPPKDDDERPQEGATCGRWGGAVDRLPRKIGDSDCGGRGGVEEVCLLVAARGSGCRRCCRKQIASSSRGPRLRLKKRATAMAEEERRGENYRLAALWHTIGRGERTTGEICSIQVQDTGRKKKQRSPLLRLAGGDGKQVEGSDHSGGWQRLLVTGALQANHVSDGICDTLCDLFTYD